MKFRNKISQWANDSEHINPYKMKNITETFPLKLSKDLTCFVTARNYNSHYIGFSNGLKDAHMTTDQMRKVAEHLIESADKIDNDPVFNT